METKNDTFGEVLGQLFPDIAAFLQQIKQIDWQQLAENFNAAVKRQIEDARTLSERGWTIPGWMTRSQILVALHLSEDELDQYFTEAYCSKEFKVLNRSFAQLKKSPGMAAWHHVLEEIRLNLVEGRYLITVPALLMVLEGFAMKQILKPSGASMKGTTSLSKRFAEMGRHEGDSIEVIPWVSNLVFMQKLFEFSDFDGDAPKLLNRHWVLHGRTDCNWSLADALRLVGALETLQWLEELEKRIAIEKESSKEQHGVSSTARNRDTV